MRVLAIETSCDETAAAVVEEEAGLARVLSSVVASQADLHARTRGVVPEVAARAHVEAITFVIGDALRQAVGSPKSPVGVKPRGGHASRWDLGPLRGRQQAVGTDAATHYLLPTTSSIDAIAATTEPGLRPALVIGEAAARALAVAWGKPFIPVNHLAGHLAAAWLVSDLQPPVVHRFPAVALIVSGGHTQLWKLLSFKSGESAIIHDSSSQGAGKERTHTGTDAHVQLTLLGQTRDDAAGEAFDKIARLLGLPYPGGPALAKLAERGAADVFGFPRPMLRVKDDDFSFSGLKTAVYYAVRKLTRSDLVRTRSDLAASAQEAIVDLLVAKTTRAAAREGVAEVILTGGVAANTRLRARLKASLGALPLVVPHPKYCTDNAAMIGAAAVLGMEIPASGQP